MTFINDDILCYMILNNDEINVAYDDE